MHLEKFQVDKIQNGRLSFIIHLDRPDIVEYHENHENKFVGLLLFVIYWSIFWEFFSAFDFNGTYSLSLI